eukprot:1344515-Rhodomonas_salina.1
MIRVIGLLRFHSCHGHRVTVPMVRSDSASPTIGSDDQAPSRSRRLPVCLSRLRLRRRLAVITISSDQCLRRRLEALCHPQRTVGPGDTVGQSRWGTSP